MQSPEKISDSSLSSEDSCDRITYYFQVTIYDLIPGEIYDLQLSSTYEAKETAEYGCRGGQCRTHSTFAVPGRLRIY